MNQLAELVSDVLTGNSFVNIDLNGEYYTVDQPCTIVVARMLKPLSKIKVKEGSNLIEILKSYSKDGQHLSEAIAWAVLGDVDVNLKQNQERFNRIKQQALKSNSTQLKDALTAILSITDAQSFFECALLAEGFTNQMSKQKAEIPL